jgi:hypothetical protein
MFKKLFFSTVLFFTTSQIFAQQIPFGMCGIVCIYDANGARVKRLYFCNNGVDPYPEERISQVLITAQRGNTIVEKAIDESPVKSQQVINKKDETIVFQNIDAIFPNPTTGRFSITFSNALNNAKIIIVDANGKIVQKISGKGNRLDFDIALFAAGVYFVRIEDNGKVISQKIVKQ